jgi:TolA-binding protein
MKIRVLIIVFLIVLCTVAGFRILVIDQLGDYYDARVNFDKAYREMDKAFSNNGSEVISKAMATIRVCFEKITWIVAHHPNEGLLSNFFKKVMSNDLLGMQGAGVMIDEFVKNYPGSPAVPWIDYLRGERKVATGDYKDAIAYFERALSAQKEIPYLQTLIMKESSLPATVNYQMGFCRLAMGETSEAETLFRSAIGLIPDSDYSVAFKIRIMGRLAEICIVQGKDDEARKIVEEINSYHSDPDKLNNLVSKLKNSEPEVFKTGFIELCKLITIRLEKALSTSAENRDSRQIINHTWRLTESSDSIIPLRPLTDEVK